MQEPKEKLELPKKKHDKNIIKEATKQLKQKSKKELINMIINLSEKVDELREDKSIITFDKFLVMPPHIIKEEIKMMPYSIDDFGNTKDLAWRNFLKQSLKIDGYLKDGYRPYKVKVKIEIAE